jgi:hypothetical protein
MVASAVAVQAQSTPSQCSDLSSFTDLGQSGFSIIGSSGSTYAPFSSSLANIATQAGDQFELRVEFDARDVSNAPLGAIDDVRVTFNSPAVTPAGVVSSVEGEVDAASGTATFPPFTVSSGPNSFYSFTVSSFASSAAPFGSGVAFRPFIRCTAAPVSTTTGITSSPNPSTPGQLVTLTATVTATSGTPAGTVEFFDDGNSLGTATLNGSGVATLATAALATGNNVITASYTPASAPFQASTSPNHTHVVNALGSSITVASSLNPSQSGDAVTFTATVTPNTATGTVEFREGAVVLGSGSLSGGTASFTTSALTVGTHPITAFYLGDSNHSASNSAPLNQVVNALPATDDSARLDDVQEAATGAAAHLASEHITDSVAEEIGAALSGTVQVVSASEGKVGLVYAPGMGKGSIITPVADVASGETDVASWRIWSSLRYTDFDSDDLEGDQINALIGASFLFGDGLVAGLVAGYEDQDYEDDVNATLKGEGFNFGGYVGGALGNGLRFDAQAHASFLDYDLASGAVTGSTDATRLIVGGGFAHTMQFSALTIEPTARFSGTWEWQDGYTDSAAVFHDARDFHFGRLSAGAKVMHRFDLGDGASLSPFVTGFADYRYSGGDTTDESLLDGLSARVGLGFDLRASNGLTTSALAEFYGLGLDDNATAKSFKAQLAIPF